MARTDYEGWMATAFDAGRGLTPAAVVATAVTQVTAASLREFHERIQTRADSTLAALDDASFAAGLGDLRRDALSETTPTPVMDNIDFLVFRSTRERNP